MQDKINLKLFEKMLNQIKKKNFNYAPGKVSMILETDEEQQSQGSSNNKNLLEEAAVTVVSISDQQS